MAGQGKTVWITRAQPGADATAARVRAHGHQAWVTPLLEVRLLPDIAYDLSGVGALAFTSANGVRAFAQARTERDLKVFAVGRATADAARAARFRTVLSTDGNVDSLADGISARRREIKGYVLHPGAEELAGDLVGLLEGYGIEARRLIVYETAPLPVPAEDIARLVTADVVLVHSAKAARALASVLRAGSQPSPAPVPKAIGISREALKPLLRTRLAGRAAPTFPLEAGMFDLIDR
ncbi:uroporphyrinogen-III synthase [Phenylobacterium immobile]|uniref:uroporphyrinogen-III synthase n=1 Tax=Phenylobacterium immobile TaxID=21 RepID=UPI000A5ACEB4|nr:uroporphyrinogen-III synthase [Phenylobacterium immobile]